MNKRKWCYVLEPSLYDCACDKCGGSNITWSEYEGMIWCYDCEIDTSGYPGIFDGPIPIGLSSMLGIVFDRINLETQKIEKMIINDKGSIEYIDIDEYTIWKTQRLLAGEKILEDENKAEASKYFKFVPSSEEDQEKFKQGVLEWASSQSKSV